MSEPVNLFQVEGDRFPFGGQLLEAMSYLHSTFEKLWPALEVTGRYAGETTMGAHHDATPVTDEEMAFYALAFDQIEATLGELMSKCKAAAAQNEERMWTTITNRGSMGMIAFGKTFKVEGEMIPKQPKEDEPEYDVLIQWAIDNGYGDFVDKPSIGFRAMQKILADRAEKMLPRPPGVTMTPRRAVKIGR